MEGKTLEDWCRFRKVLRSVVGEGSVQARVGAFSVVVLPRLGRGWHVLAQVGRVGVSIRRESQADALDVAEQLLKRADAGQLDEAGLRSLRRQMARRQVFAF